MDHDPVNRGMEIYTQLGFAGLFAFVFLVQFFFMLFDRRKHQAELVRIVEKSAACIEQAAQSNRTIGATNDQLRSAVENSTRQTGELIAYLKGRDSAGGRRS